jgi:Zn-dependent peptidase ImmA (M78 family)
MDKIHIEKKANEFLCGINDFPLPLIRLAEEKLSYEVLFLDNEVAGVAGKVNYTTKKIFVKQSDMPQRQRFTIAHEIGHIVLHARGVNANNQENSSREDHNINDDELTVYANHDPEREAEANYFAGCLLMPSDEYKKVWYRYDGDIFFIAMHFNVSRLSASVRANTLGLMSF